VYQHWSSDAGVAIVTLAPELPGATAAITALSDAGVVVSGGHSTATAGHAAAAADAGMSMVTHLFNAMAPIGHRAPNLAGFALADQRITTGVIVDGVHVDPLMVHVAWRSAGPRRFVLVSDAVAAMGLGAGEHQLGGRTVTADHNSVRTPDGTLAGTNLTMDAAVRNLMAFTDADLPAALQAASATPAALLGLNDRGNIASGERADLVLLDNQHRVAMTVCAGQTVYVAPDHRWRLAPTS
jgi:N-acetylglucosamine-6-phosphate deacetylase